MNRFKRTNRHLGKNAKAAKKNNGGVRSGKLLLGELLESRVFLSGSTPDLIVAKPTVMTAGGQSVIQWTVTDANSTGSLSATSPITDEIYLTSSVQPPSQIGPYPKMFVGTFSLASPTVPNFVTVTPNSYTYTAYLSLPYSPYTNLEVIANYTKSFPETNYDNDYAATTIQSGTSGGYISLVANTISAYDLTSRASTSPFYPGDTLSLNWQDTNLGNASVSANTHWTDSVFFSPNPPASVGGSTSGDVLLGNFSEYTYQALSTGFSAYAYGQVTLPSYITGGSTGYLLIQTDPYHQIPNENPVSSNSQLGVFPFFIGSAASPDIVPTSVDTTSTANTGDLITVTWDDYNQGVADVSPYQSWTDSLYLSATPSLDLSDPSTTLLDSFAQNGPIAASNYQAAPSSDQVTLPSDIQSGTYYVIVQADTYDELGESSLTDKTDASAPIDVTLTQPDLITSSISAPAAVSPGQTITTSWTDTNIGPGNEASYWEDAIYISSTPTVDSSAVLLQYAQFGPLASGASAGSGDVSVTIPATDTSGKYLVVQTNYQSEAPESNTANDIAFQPIQLRTNVDLEVQSITNPVQANDQTITVAWTGINNGTDPTWTGGWTDAVYLSTSPGEVNPASPSPAYLANTFTVTSDVQPGQTYTGSAPVFVSGSQTVYYITVVADAFGDQPEAGAPHELESSTPLAVGFSDLTITGLDVPATATISSKIGLSFTDLNQGTVPTYGYSQDNVYISNSSIFSTSTSSLLAITSNSDLGVNATASQSVSISTLGYAPGQYYIYVVADADNSIVESNETNNIVSSPLSLHYSNADLQVSNVQVIGDYVLPSGLVSVADKDPLMVTATITNVGTDPTLQNSGYGITGAFPEWTDEVGLYNDQRGTVLAGLEISGGLIPDGQTVLQPGQSETVSVQCSVYLSGIGYQGVGNTGQVVPTGTGGLWYVGVLANVAGTQPEADMGTEKGAYNYLGDNNIAFKQIGVTDHVGSVIIEEDNYPYETRDYSAFTNLKSLVTTLPGDDVVLTGHVFSEYYAPQSEFPEVVDVALAGSTQQVPIDSSDNFTATFGYAATDLHPGASYTPIYYFAGDELFSPAIDRFSTVVNVLASNQPTFTNSGISNDSLYQSTTLDQYTTLSANISAGSLTLNFGTVTFTVSKTLENSSVGGSLVVATLNANVSANQASTQFDIKGLAAGIYEITAEYNSGLLTYLSSTSDVPLQLTIKLPLSLTPPANQTAEATSPNGSVVTYPAAIATDPLQPVTLSYSQDSGTVFPLGQTDVTVTATDSSGNQVQAEFTVTVQDKTPPAITVPGTLTLEATGPNGVSVTATVTADDTVSGAVPVTCSYYSTLTGQTVQFAPGTAEQFPLGTTTVTARAVDGAGNASTASYQVVVQDTTPPVFTYVPSSLTIAPVNLSGGTLSGFVPAMATDAVTTSPTITYSVAGVTINPATYTFKLNSVTTVNILASDAAGNTAAAAFTVTVAKINPVISWPTPQAIQYNTPLSGVQLNAIATDASGPVLGTYSYRTASGANAYGAVLAPGTGQAIQVTFVPKDTVDYNSVTSTVNITVIPPVNPVTAETPISYGRGSSFSNQSIGVVASVGQHTLIISNLPTDVSISAVSLPGASFTFVNNVWQITFTEPLSGEVSLVITYKNPSNYTLKPVFVLQ